MLALVISTVLLVLAVVLVVLTRLRLARPDASSGRLDIPAGLVNAHTALGTLGILMWGGYLYLGVDWVVGFLGLLLWWGATVVGLLILARWLPAKGRHAAAGATDTWTEGPWLSVLGHVGALVGAVVWSGFFVAGAY